MTAAPRDVRQLLADAAAALPGVEGRHEAELLLLHVLRRERSWLFAHANDTVAQADADAFAALLARRVAGEPVAYLIGNRGFWTLDLTVTPATLIPRPETELLVELALARLPLDVPQTVADLGTGSGAIALALASERPLAQVIATDFSAAALAVASANAVRNAVRNVSFRQGSWFAPLAGMRLDLIASNPPYIASDDPHLQQGDLRFEPATALAAGPDGLDDIRRIIDGATAHLRPGGWLLLEHGWDQSAAVQQLLSAAGFSDIQSKADLAGIARCTGGSMKP